MIVDNAPIANQTEIDFEFLDGLTARFYLCGSRKMAQLYPHIFKIENGLVTLIDDLCLSQPLECINSSATDYDFHVTWNGSLQNTLTKYGFTETTGNGTKYMDDEAIFICEKGNIQVVMRHDSEFYENVFCNIDPTVYVNALWKSSPATVDRSMIQHHFNQYFRIAHAFSG